MSIAGLIPVVLYDIMNHDEYKFIGLAFVIAYIIGLFLLSLVILFAIKLPQYVQAALLSASIILLIGFSICTF